MPMYRVTQTRTVTQLVTADTKREAIARAEVSLSIEDRREAWTAVPVCPDSPITLPIDPPIRPTVAGPSGQSFDHGVSHFTAADFEREAKLFSEFIRRAYMLSQAAETERDLSDSRDGDSGDCRLAGASTQTLARELTDAQAAANEADAVNIANRTREEMIAIYSDWITAHQRLADVNREIAYRRQGGRS